MFWYCTIWVTIASSANLCSTLFLLSMTFDRCYSIIRPHKTASFNTVQRAKITITCIVVFSMFFNIPHLFATAQRGRKCNPIGKVFEYPYLRIYSCLTSVKLFFAICPSVVNEYSDHTYLGSALRNSGQNSKSISRSK